MGSLDQGVPGGLEVSWEEVSLSRAQSNQLPSSLRVGEGHSPFGRCLLAECPRGLRHLWFFDEEDYSHQLQRLSRFWPRAVLEWDDSLGARYESIWSKAGDMATHQAPVRGVVQGTAFQLHVWQVLLQIPRGRVMTYTSLAAAAGYPDAVRAVGSALGKNPLAYLLPCHRIIPADGSTGQYRWGAQRKRDLLHWETPPTGYSELSTRLVIAPKGIGRAVSGLGKNRAKVGSTGKATQLRHGRDR